MKLQFLHCKNPNMPEQGEYIEHHAFPRFTAKVVNDDLVIIRKLDGENADYSGKLERARKWYVSIKNKIHEYNR